MKDIYTFVLQNGELLEEHRVELQEKRGFSDKTIKEARFISGGPHNAKLEALLRDKFPETDLISSSVFVFDAKQKKAVLNPIFLSVTNTLEGRSVSGIIIPYLNTDGACYVLRPHKLGLKGIPSEIYQECNLKEDPGEIILTEGEFKAVAGNALGLPTIAVPGIQSFAESKYSQLADFLKSKKVQKIVVVFDNEVKDNPELPSYKDDPSKRHDTPFYAYYMATRLEQSGFEVRIGTLPDAWREKGKIDIDGALKQGRDRGDLMRVMYDALPRNEYLRELPSEAKQVVLRKRAQKVNKGNISKEFNRYIAHRQRGKNSWQDTISNFIIRVIATHETPDGVKRELEFINEYGTRSGSFMIDAEAMSSSDKFRTFCLRKGDFSWKGTLEDLMTIWESEFLMMDEGRYIVDADHVGWIESEKVWLFGNIAIGHDKDGKTREIRPDKGGVIWMDKRGVKTSALSVTTGKSSIEEGIPYLNIGAKVDMVDLKKRLAESIGDHEAAVALGWITSVAFMEDVFAYCGSFPFLFVTGQTSSGKSTVAEWFMRFFGIDGGGKVLSQTTPVAIQRLLGYYSCLPVFLDEYRNSKEIIPKTGFLRNVYNRQSSGKGTKEGFGLREAKVRGTLIVAGEETPKDAALLSRFIPIFISRSKRRVNHYNWFQANKGKFSAHFYDVLRRRHELGMLFASTFKKWQDAFIAKGIEDRLALNYATVVAGYVVAFGEKDVTFTDWLIKETAAVQAEQYEERALAIFFEDLLALKTRKLITGEQFYVADNERAYLYFHGLHQVWSEQFKKYSATEAFKKQSMLAYLKEEPGYVEKDFVKKIGGQACRCVVFNLRTCSRDIQILVDQYHDGESNELFTGAPPATIAAAGLARAAGEREAGEEG